jgi:uncharacterized small protein (DUF1192 family)
MVAGFTGHSSPLTYDAMNWTPSATPADVLRMVAKYVERQFSLPSAAGRMAIDESRVTRRKVGNIDLEDLSLAEALDAIKTATIRRAVYAAPSMPRPRGRDGQPINRVIGIREVAAIVKPRSKMGGGRPQVSVRDWCGTIAQKVKEAGAGDLVTVAKIRQERGEKKNQLSAAERVKRRMKNGPTPSGKHDRERHFERLRACEERIAELRAEILRLSAEISDITRTQAYRDAPDALLVVCTETAEIEAYIFGELL